MITLAISLNGCKHSIDLTWDSGPTDNEFVVGAVPNSTVCVHEKGVFFFSYTGKLSYHDYNSKDSLRWELVQINVQEQTLKVLTTFGNETSTLDGWTISNVESAYYSNRKVWAKENFSEYSDVT